MREDLVASLRLLARAESVVAAVQLRRSGRRLVLAGAAAIAGIAGCGLMLMAAYLRLAPVLGADGAAAAVGAATLAVAAVLAGMAARSRPPEGELLATEMRDAALAKVEADARALMADVGGLADSVRLFRQRPAGSVQEALDSVLPHLVVPLARLLLRHLRKTPAAD